MINRKFIITDITLFSIGLLLFVCSSIINNYFESPSMVLDIIISVICVLLVIVLTVLNYKKVELISKANLFFPFVLMLLLFVLYHLPMFDFIGTTGIQNGICGLFVFTLFSRFALNLSEFLKINYGYTITPSNLRANTQGRGAITGAYVIAKILRVYAIFVFVGGIAIAMLNAFFSVIDMSVPYQMIFLNRTMTEIFNR